MLSFEFSPEDQEVIKVHCDIKGINNLIKILSEYRDSEMDHIHISSPFAGGSDLDDTTPKGNKAVSEVIVTLRR